jgi:hypothetical protein
MTVEPIPYDIWHAWLRADGVLEAVRHVDWSEQSDQAARQSGQVETPDQGGDTCLE